MDLAKQEFDNYVYYNYGDGAAGIFHVEMDDIPNQISQDDLFDEYDMLFENEDDYEEYDGEQFI